MVAAALVACVAAMLLVRLGWRGWRGVAPAGWVLAAAALVALTTQAGAWGLAVGATAGGMAALALVLHAGWAEPHRTPRPVREATATPAVELRHLGRRATVFLLVVPIAFIAAQWLAFGAQALARRFGAGEADATAATLLLQPLLWSALMAWQMTRAGPAAMVAAPAGAAMLGTLLWGVS